MHARAPEVHRSTVYRTLDVLVEDGLVLRADLGGDRSYYELAAEHHHHHVVCTSCGAVAHVHDEAIAAAVACVQAASGYRLARQELTFAGLCPDARLRSGARSTIAAVSNSRLVYSSDDGDQRRAASRTARPSQPQAPSDGIVRVAREKSGRKGKTVTVVRGLPPADARGSRRRPQTPLRHRRHRQGRSGRTAGRPPRQSSGAPAVKGLRGEARRRVTSPKVETAAPPPSASRKTANLSQLRPLSSVGRAPPW